MLPGGEAESGEVQIAGVAGALADVVFGAVDVHPGGVVDGGGGTGDDIVAGESGGSFFHSVDVMPVEDEGLFGEISEGVWVLEEHIAPHGWFSSSFDDAVNERGKMVVVKPGFFVIALVCHTGGAFGAFPELCGFVAADMDDFGFEYFDCLDDECFAEIDEIGAGGAGLETSVCFFAELATFFDVEEPFEMAEEVDERDDLERREFALEGLDLIGGDCAFAVAPGG